MTADGSSRTDTDGTDDETATAPTLRERAERTSTRSRDLLYRARAHPRDRWLALAGAALLGLALAWLHWTGLVVAGVLLGVVSRTLWRGLIAAFGFGVLVLVVFAATLGGAVGEVLAMTPAVYLTVAAALGLPVFGSLVRGFG